MPNDQAVVANGPTIHGSAFAGGFYAGRIRLDDGVYALIVAPKAEGETSSKWHTKSSVVDGARSFYDGLANTDSMVTAGSKLAQWARGLRIGGFNDWYLPSRDELELCYRAFKPGTYRNYCWRGDNPSSVPVGYAYAPDAPAQTSEEAFRAGGVNAFEEEWYWTSTQFAGASESAWSQDFTYGDQSFNPRGLNLRARAVRRVKL